MLKEHLDLLHPCFMYHARRFCMVGVDSGGGLVFTFSLVGALSRQVFPTSSCSYFSVCELYHGGKFTSGASVCYCADNARNRSIEQNPRIPFRDVRDRLRTGDRRDGNTPPGRRCRFRLVPRPPRLPLRPRPRPDY